MSSAKIKTKSVLLNEIAVLEAGINELKATRRSMVCTACVMEARDGKLTNKYTGTFIRPDGVVITIAGNPMAFTVGMEYRMGLERTGP